MLQTHYHGATTDRTAVEASSDQGEEATVNGRRSKTLNLYTYKWHAIGDVVPAIKLFGTTDSYSTQIVSVYVSRANGRLTPRSQNVSTAIQRCITSGQARKTSLDNCHASKLAKRAFENFVNSLSQTAVKATAKMRANYRLIS